MGRKTDSGTESFGALLRRYRGIRGLTQGELGDRAGIHAQEISKLERDVVRSPRSTTVGFLAEALKLDAHQRVAFAAAARGMLPPAGGAADGSDLARRAPVGLAAAQSLLADMPADVLPERRPLPAGSRMPLAANPLFVGRGGELLQVARLLRGGGRATVAVGQVVASTGLGGLGKTQLAVELVHRYGRFFAGGVFWLSFARADEIPLQVAACAAPEFERRSLEERVELVTAAWRSALPRLLVFDNCEEEALLAAWRPTSGGCRVVVTSRRAQWSPTLGVAALPLDLLPRPDSIELLLRYRPDLAADDPRLDAVAGRLGDLPLALHLAGRYLLTYRAEVSLDDYAAELDQPALIRHASLLGERLDDSPSPTRHVQSVAQTFALCVGRLDERREVDRVALAMLARMACLAPGEPVPGDLLAKTLAEVDARRRADGLRRLEAVGLVEKRGSWLRLHRLLVHFVRQEGVGPDSRRAVARALIGCGEDAELGHLTGPALAAVVPHLVDAAGRGTDDELLASELCNAAGRALRHAGDLGAARPFYQRALAIRERVLGPDHPDTAEALNNLGVMLWAQGELDDARCVFERALAIRERVLGPDHRATAEGLNNLAALLRGQGDLDGAGHAFERALAIRERVLGPDHPTTAWSLHALGCLLRDKGELNAARPLLERALAIRERTLGPDHPGTAYSLNGLARLLHVQGELDHGRLLHERALGIRERALGPDHPDTAQSLNNLARLLRDRGEPDAARLMYERALAIRERVLGPVHPDSVATRRALAELEAEGAGSPAGA